MNAKHEGWANVAVFEDFNASKMAENFLESKGIQARTYDDKWFRYFLFLRPPRVTYRLQVPKSDLTRANEILDDGKSELLQKAMHCPSCHSLSVNYPQMTRKFILPTVLLHLGIIFRIVDHDCYCEHCQFTWNLPRKNKSSFKKSAVPMEQTH